ncbi:phage virulence factor PagK family protein [Citrobacter braakii]|nr:phage virulence factor [Salmonella enterica subsp. enterica serovar Newport]MBJ9048891.1 phage virulence factor PagK family protein [Citrobacter braakii]
MKHVKSILFVVVFALTTSLYSTLTIAADTQNQEKAETIKPIPSKWCNLWPSDVPMPSDWFKICKVY